MWAQRAIPSLIPEHFCSNKNIQVNLTEQEKRKEKVTEKRGLAYHIMELYVFLTKVNYFHNYI